MLYLGNLLRVFAQEDLAFGDVLNVFPQTSNHRSSNSFRLTKITLLSFGDDQKTLKPERYSRAEVSQD